MSNGTRTSSIGMFFLFILKVLHKREKNIFLHTSKLSTCRFVNSMIQQMQSMHKQSKLIHSRARVLRKWASANVHVHTQSPLTSRSSTFAYHNFTCVSKYIKLIQLQYEPECAQKLISSH